MKGLSLDEIRKRNEAGKVYAEPVIKLREHLRAIAHMSGTKGDCLGDAVNMARFALADVLVPTPEPVAESKPVPLDYCEVCDTNDCECIGLTAPIISRESGKPKVTAPRYDDVFLRGMETLDKMSIGEDTDFGYCDSHGEEAHVRSKECVNWGPTISREEKV